VAAMYGAMFLMFYVLKKKSILRVEMKETEDRSPETEEEKFQGTEDRSPETEEGKCHVIMHNGLGQGIKVGRPVSGKRKVESEGNKEVRSTKLEKREKNKEKRLFESVRSEEKNQEPRGKNQD
jgi:hypothetical protein